MDSISSFARLARLHSNENRRAMGLLLDAGLYPAVLSVLRQELDTLLRVIHLSSVDEPERRRLTQELLAGNGWRKPTGGRIQDLDMLETARSVLPWKANLIYKYGCACIHLSELHNYTEEDPFKALPLNEQEAITTAISSWWGPNWIDKTADELEFTDIIRFLPRVYEKISAEIDIRL